MVDAGSWKPVFDAVLPLADVVICSADFRFTDSPDTAAALLGRGVPRVAISRGADPILWWSADRREHGTADRPAAGAVPVPSAQVRDTLGAGDVLHGAFARRLADSPGAAFPEVLAYAAAVATARCAHVGISSWRNHLLGRLPR